VTVLTCVEREEFDIFRKKKICLSNHKLNQVERGLAVKQLLRVSKQTLLEYRVGEFPIFEFLLKHPIESFDKLSILI